MSLFYRYLQYLLKGTHPASYVIGTRGSFPGGKADHSPPSRTKVKNAWSYTSAPQYTFLAWCSVKAQGQLYLFHHILFCGEYLRRYVPYDTYLLR